MLLGLVFVSQAQTKHYIGEGFDGGIVFDVSADSLHGLVAQRANYNDKLNFTYSLACATVVTDNKLKGYRLPTGKELQKLYAQRVIVGGFNAVDYFYSDSNRPDMAKPLGINFNDGSKSNFNRPDAKGKVRLVKSF